MVILAGLCHLLLCSFLWAERGKHDPQLIYIISSSDRESCSHPGGTVQGAEGDISFQD